MPGGAAPLPQGASCPCGRGDRYEICCAPFHSGSANAPTAERLMRSRYSAFALGLADYLRHSWHPDTLPPDFGADDVRWEDGFQWIGLAIESVEAGGPFDAEGTVTFTAVARGPEGRFAQRERSRFVRVAGAADAAGAGAAGAASGARWVYVDGVQLDV